ncbi:hypothetical protein Htur_0581 [Haloterrigena turkmenica DSM 5511]|uniref:Uncharacterized protein n=1 Tax=Haloterrigena turkmenica (strain ATCC 51198 / DSM 5511 / JCM 9101 / NCIMB 13204 / VKM B-1734 / 4k) TaxID=543526 RepID=D2RW90_HALTV|nr:hypothetical protein [Haloterrigena turkmenica]ADB59479.1 hypothetical protein Htur_0581 [Haloterrigena turkmenica DSM 5511]
MYHPPYESGEIVDDGDLAFIDDGLETPERYVGFEDTLVVVAPDVRRHVTPADAVTGDTSLLECYPVAADWFQEPYCDDDTVLIHPEGAAVAHRYRVVDERRDPIERDRRTPSSA